MSFFSKAVDYNLILENILEKKRFSATVKNLLSSMIYKIETSYTDYANVKRFSKTKDQFLAELVNSISEYLENIKIVEPDSEDSKLFKKFNVLAITNESEKLALAYPSEASLLYAVSDIKPKFFYIDNYIFKKEFQDMLVDGNNLNTLEVLEDFSGWSWNPKSAWEKNYIANLIYQNLIMLFGLDFMDKCKNSQSKDFDIVFTLKKNCKEYYKKLTEVIYLKNKNKKMVNNLEKQVSELKQFQNKEKFIKNANIKIDLLNSKIDRIENIISNEAVLKKSFSIKNSKLEEGKKFKSLNSYINYLNKEKEEYFQEIEKWKKLSEVKIIESFQSKLKQYQELLNLDKTLEQAVIELQMCFIKILYKNSKEIKTREEFIDIIYKIRYYRNIFVSKDRAIKDIDVLEDLLNKMYKRIITFGTKASYIKMVSRNISLNSRILVECLDSRSMELENLKLKIDMVRQTILVEVFENKIFEKKFDFRVKEEDPEFTVKKNKVVKIFI